MNLSLSTVVLYTAIGVLNQLLTGDSLVLQLTQPSLSDNFERGAGGLPQRPQFLVLQKVAFDHFFNRDTGPIGLRNGARR